MSKFASTRGISRDVRAVVLAAFVLSCGAVQTSTPTVDDAGADGSAGAGVAAGAGGQNSGGAGGGAGGAAGGMAGAAGQMTGGAAGVGGSGGIGGTADAGGGSGGYLEGGAGTSDATDGEAKEASIASDADAGQTVQTAVSLDDVSAFAAAAGLFTKVPYITELYDDRNEVDSGSRFTASEAGDYEVCASLWSGSDTTAFELDMYINGARENAFAYSGATTIARGCRVVRLAATNYVEVWVHHASAAPMAFSSNTFWNWMTIQKVPSRASLDDVTAFSAAAGVFTKVPYGAELYDDRNEVDSGKRFTASEAGDYEVCASLWSGTDTTAFELDAYVNGARENAFAYSGATTVAQGCRVVRLAATDYVEVWVHHASASAMAFPANTFWAWMTIHKVPSRASLDDVTAFSAAAGVFTKVPYGAELYDDRNEVDSGKRFTASEAGDYEVCASLWSGTDTTAFELDAYVNGARENAFAYSGATTVAQGCRVVRLAASDYVEVWVHHASASPVAFPANTFWAWMTVTELRR